MAQQRGGYIMNLTVGECLNKFSNQGLAPKEKHP